MMIYNSKKDAIADNYFNRINAFSFSTINSNFNVLTLQPIAWFFLGLTSLSKRVNNIKTSRRYAEKYKVLHKVESIIPKIFLNDQFDYEDREISDEEYIELRQHL
ncbi:hypothetical protein JEM67_20770 [Serratia sp. PAMC26656]|uniref:hypothetical protein n=1 Tax=Serratia sp. PAMC26656 TaxID=2775909 RepID=UPI0018F42E4D|nr:hypothetical protein [Serratia sp. PAMC26656]MBJ7892254.1 hypothetical protein [Serratia sp. PAMC26656]